MISLQRTRDPKLLVGYSGARLLKKVEKLVDYYYLDGGHIDFKPKTRQVWGNAKARLKIESHGKCAYCEADTSVVAHGDVEHFRPKDIYWWLAYCYDNYTFACQICNQSYKGVHFPITGTILTGPALPKKKPTDAAQLAVLLATICPDPVTSTTSSLRALFRKEKSHLIDPYINDPEKYFAWKVDDIAQEVRLVKGKSRVAGNALAAAETYLGLNREELRRLRWADYKTLEVLVLAFQNGKFSAAFEKTLHAQILKFADSNQSFCGMHRFFLRKWGFIS